MNEKIDQNSDSISETSINNLTNITTTGPLKLTGTSSSYSSVDHNLTATNNNSIIYSSGSNFISFSEIVTKDHIVKNILDRIIELKSLTKKSDYEFFDIKKIKFEKKFTKINCSKEIDLNYLDNLKKQSQLLNECIDLPCDNYKEKALRKYNESSLIYNGDGIIWTNGTNNTITIDPSIYNLTNVTNTTNINYITYTA